MVASSLVIFRCALETDRGVNATMHEGVGLRFQLHDHMKAFKEQCTRLVCVCTCTQVLNQLQMLTQSEAHMAQGVKYMDRAVCLSIHAPCSLSSLELVSGNLAGHEGKDATDDQGSGLEPMV